MPGCWIELFFLSSHGILLYAAFLLRLYFAPKAFFLFVYQPPSIQPFRFNLCFADSSSVLNSTYSKVFYSLISSVIIQRNLLTSIATTVQSEDVSILNSLFSNSKLQMELE